MFKSLSGSDVPLVKFAPRSSSLKKKASFDGVQVCWMTFKNESLLPDLMQSF